jgi:hypothetical protein
MGADTIEMGADEGAFAETEAQPRPLNNVPDNERAKEIGRESDADIHGDPDDPSPIASPTEAESVAQWRVAKCLLMLRSQINRLAPRRRKLSDGTIGDAAHSSRSSDHNPWVRDGATGVVTAMDITHDPANGCDGSTLAAVLRAARDSRIKYIIWNRKIANSSAVGGAAAWAWRDYRGSNPHTHHIHVSVKPEKPSYDSEVAWALPTSLGPSPSA